MRCWLMTVAAAVLAGFTWALSGPPVAAADGWGTIKGQVVYQGKVLPKAEPVKVDKDQKHCLQNGPIKKEDWVINPKNKGVRYGIVWLAPDPAAENQELPINSKLRKIKDKRVTIDQPCCMFVPHVVAIREGQELFVKNSAPIAHSVRWTGNPAVNLGGNVTVPPKGSYTIKDLKAQRLPIKLDCGFHGWMNGWVAVFKHPYFAVTDKDGKFVIKDAPAGTYRLIVWQESIGFRGGAAGRNGQKITIKADGVTNLGKLGIEADKGE